MEASVPKWVRGGWYAGEEETVRGSGYDVSRDRYEGLGGEVWKEGARRFEAQAGEQAQAARKLEVERAEHEFSHGVEVLAGYGIESAELGVEYAGAKGKAVEADPEVGEAVAPLTNRDMASVPEYVKQVVVGTGGGQEAAGGESEHRANEESAQKKRRLLDQYR